MEVVTWTFDAVALFIGFVAGMFAGGLISLCVEMRTGGSWSSGFNAGCKLKHIVERLENLVETKKEETK